MWLLGVLFGSVVGFALGLTGGGGSIFAVPLLIYGMSTEPREAIGVSLAAVGATATVGLVQRLLRREVEVGTGMLFAFLGMAGAPVGTWLNSLVPSPVLLAGFAGLMVVVAVRMWRKATIAPDEARIVRAAFDSPPADDVGPVCRRDAEGKLRMTSRCGVLLSFLGLLTGVMSGLFGVGGGFVIVPALVLFSGMSIHRAVATSLLIIALVSASGVASYVAAGRPLNLTLTAAFALGGALGMFGGVFAGRKISGPSLQKVFSAAMITVAIWMGIRQFV